MPSAITPSIQLGETGEAFFYRLLSVFGGRKLDRQLQDMIALMADAMETYLTAQSELQSYVANTGVLTTNGSNGNLTPHPALKIQQQALTSYLTIARQIRASLPTQEEKKKAPDDGKLKALIEEVK